MLSNIQGYHKYVIEPDAFFKTYETKFYRHNFNQAIELGFVTEFEDKSGFIINDIRYVEGPDSLGFHYFIKDGVRLGFPAYNRINTKKLNSSLRTGLSVRSKSIYNSVSINTIKTTSMKYIQMLQEDYDLGFTMVANKYVELYGTKKAQKLAEKVNHRKITELLNTYLSHNAKLDPDILLNRVNSIGSMIFWGNTAIFILSLTILTKWSQSTGKHEFNKSFLSDYAVHIYNELGRPALF